MRLRLTGILHFGDRVALRAEPGSQQAPDRRLVVNDQDLD